MLAVFYNPQNVPVYKTQLPANLAERFKLPTLEVWGSQQSNMSLEPRSPVSSLVLNLMLPLKQIQSGTWSSSFHQ